MKDGMTNTLHMLCDSGTAESVISEKYTKELKMTKDKKQNWSTVSGTFQTKGKTKAEFKLPELNSFAQIDYKFHVAPLLGAYDMIIGHDIMKETGLIIDFANE
eukprot:6257257-Ditylum_brightwellii.AAC.1